MAHFSLSRFLFQSFWSKRKKVQRLETVVAQLRQKLRESERALQAQAQQNKRLTASLAVLGTELAEAKQRVTDLEPLVFIDHLTGVLNPRGAEAEFRHEVHRAFRDHFQKNSRATPVPVSVIFIDLDNFKPVNDYFGHIAGDRVLKEVAATLKETCREGDAVCRKGGDEFAIYMADITITAAEKKAGQIFELLQRHPKLALGPLRVTASVGTVSGVIETLQGIDRAYAELGHRADLAMYTAKRSGKSQVHNDRHLYRFG